ncbi:hypothetical protein BH10PAT3_BH10PAT3_7210 [soil metagenome]
MPKSFNSFIESVAPELSQVRSEQQITNCKESRGLGFVALIANGSSWLEDYLRDSLRIDGTSSVLVELEPQSDIASPLLGLHLSRGKFRLVQNDLLSGQLISGQIGIWNAAEQTDRHAFTVSPQVVLSESHILEIIGASGEYRRQLDFTAITNASLIKATEESF